MPVLLHVAKNGKAEEKKLAIKALGTLADPAMSTELVQMLRADPYAGQRASIVKALVTLGTRDRTPEGVCDAAFTIAVITGGANGVAVT